MNISLKRIVRSGFRKFGYDVQRTSAPSRQNGYVPDLWLWLRDTQGIRTVIDIGANNGDFAGFLANHFKATRVYAFEPLASCIPDLQKKRKTIRGLDIFNVALADYTGEGVFFENSYGPASSFLPVSEISKREFPTTVGDSSTKVQVRRLDDMVNPEALDANILVKIDVQGLEDQVIRGGQRVLTATRAVLIEMSFVPMYDGQPLFEEVHEQLVRLGFRFTGIKNQIDSPRSGQPLFAHCLYIRSGSG